MRLLTIAILLSCSICYAHNSTKDDPDCAELGYFVVLAHSQWDSIYLRSARIESGKLLINFYDQMLNDYEAALSLKGGCSTDLPLKEIVNGTSLTLLRKNCLRQSRVIPINKAEFEKVKKWKINPSDAIYSTDIPLKLKTDRNDIIPNCFSDIHQPIQPDIVVDGVNGKINALINTDPELTDYQFISLVKLLRDLQYETNSSGKDVRTTLTFVFK